MRDPGSRWVARELCIELVENGLGARWLPLLERVSKVHKSAWASKAQREQLTPQRHFDSLAVRKDLAVGPQVTVVDDFITAGKTMLACVAKLAEAYPSAAVRGFALVRTMSDVVIERIKDPCAGTISITPWGTRREP